MAVLILNGGSTGWKVAAFDDVPADAEPVIAARAAVTTTGSDAGTLDAACRELATKGALDGLRAVGHRIVHGGGRFAASVRIDDDVEAALRSFEPLAPSHNALEIAGIETAKRLFPNVPQNAVFDTAFHRTLAAAAYTYPGPYAWRERGIRRFGFHGSSVAYCVERAAQLLRRDVSENRLIVAHLGGGCSVTAVSCGESVDTSMGFTPLDGTMMGTRSGAVDPGILTYLARAGSESASSVADVLDRSLNHESGLAGISGISGDVRELDVAAASGNERAELALEMFAHRAATTIAGMTSSLDRLDAVTFTGGIGEHSAPMRARICAKLRVLGLSLDAATNDASAAGDRRIDAAGPAILAIATQEEWYAARECARVLAPT